MFVIVIKSYFVRPDASTVGPITARLKVCLGMKLGRL